MIFLSKNGGNRKMILSRLFIMIMIQITICSFISAEATAEAIDGQELYNKHCAICHGNDGKGKTDLGEGLGARDFTEMNFQDSITDEEIIEQITNGTEEKMMPFKDKLTLEEMNALVPVIRAFGEK